MQRGVWFHPGVPGHLEPVNAAAATAFLLARRVGGEPLTYTGVSLVMPSMRSPKVRSTTVLSVRARGSVVLVGDGQVTMGEGVIKHHARKIRRLYNNRVLAGFAGSTADAFSLFARFETKLEQFHGNLSRSAVELAKDWRTDRALRHLEALLVVSDPVDTFLLSGQGDVIEPDDGICAIGSGGPYALAAARALLRHTELPAKVIAEQALGIAADICIYTNHDFTVEELASTRPEAAPAEPGR